MMNENHTMQSRITMYTTKDIQRIFQCSQACAYAIMHLPGFPVIRFNAKMLVEENALKNWLKQQGGQRVILKM